MNWQKFALAVISSFLIMFFLAGVWDVIFRLLREEQSSIARAFPLVWLMALAYALLAGLMVMVYPTVNIQSKVWLKGAKFGILIGLLWVVPHSLLLYGFYEFPLSILAGKAFWALLEQGVGGIAIALILKE